MDPIFIILALPLLIHLVGCYYVDHLAIGSPDSTGKEVVNKVIDYFDLSKEKA